MSLTVTLHCKPYIRHWLLNNYDTDKNRNVTLPPKSNERLVILSFLVKTFHPSRDYNKKAYQSEVNFRINGHDLSEHGSSIRPARQYFINRWFEHRMELELFVFVVSQTVNGTGVNEAIRTYHQLNNFEELITFDGLETKYHRFRQKLKGKIFSISDSKNIADVSIKPQ